MDKEQQATIILRNRNATGRKMTKMFFCIVLTLSSGFSIAAAKAIPVAPIGAEPAKLATPVADGCGFNRYRDARGICRKKYVITPHRGRQPSIPDVAA